MYQHFGCHRSLVERISARRMGPHSLDLWLGGPSRMLASNFHSLLRGGAVCSADKTEGSPRHRWYAGADGARNGRASRGCDQPNTPMLRDDGLGQPWRVTGIPIPKSFCRTQYRSNWHRTASVVPALLYVPADVRKTVVGIPSASNSPRPLISLHHSYSFRWCCILHCPCLRKLKA